MTNLHDSEGLISNETESNGCSKYLFIFFKLFEIAATFSAVFFSSDFEIFFIIVSFCLSIFDVFFCKFQIGYDLVGLTYKLHFFKCQADYIIKPDPFVPKSYDSNLFWSGLVLIPFFYFISSLFVPLFLILLCLHCLNLAFFIKANQIVNKETAENVKNALLGDTEVFQQAPDYPIQ